CAHSNTGWYFDVW
nr:immunoglobulin heavy chain junction region [Mus musculus]